MPASFSPAPNSMASLSIEEGAGARQSPSTLDTATTTVPVVIPVEKEKEDLVGASSSLGEKDGEKDGKKKKNRCLSCKKKVGRQVNPVSPTFFLQERHLFFFFFPSFSPSFSPRLLLAPTRSSFSFSTGITTGTVVVAVSRVEGLCLAPAPSSMLRLAMLLGAGLKDAGRFVGGACFFLTISL